MQYLVGLVVVVLLGYLLVVYVLLPGLAILLALTLGVFAVGALWGLVGSFVNLMRAIRHNVTFRGRAVT